MLKLHFGRSGIFAISDKFVTDIVDQLHCIFKRDEFCFSHGLVNNWEYFKWFKVQLMQIFVIDFCLIYVKNINTYSQCANNLLNDIHRSFRKNPHQWTQRVSLL